MADKDALRENLIALLEGGQAHIGFRDAVKGFPAGKAGVRPANSPHSAWELLEHIRIAQQDILRFSTGVEGPNAYVPLQWPEDYWPKSPAPDDSKQWNHSVSAIERDLTAFVALIRDTGRDLFAPFPWGEGQTLLREALVLADHNSYHLGQLLLVRKVLEAAS